MQDGETYHWWADLLETEPCRKRLEMLAGETVEPESPSDVAGPLEDQSSGRDAETVG